MTVSTEATTIRQDDYANKPEDYYGHSRRDYVAELPESDTAAILEIGCAEGATGVLAIRNGNAGATWASSSSRTRHGARARD